MSDTETDSRLAHQSLTLSEILLERLLDLSGTGWNVDKAIAHAERARDLIMTTSLEIVARNEQEAAVRDPITVETDLGRFTITQNSPTSGRILSSRALLDGRVYAIDTRWNIRAPEQTLVISTLGLNVAGTAAQAARGNWYAGALRILKAVLEPHILSFVEKGAADAPQ